MRYEVKLTVRAEQDYRQAYQWYVSHSPDAAERWFNGMEAALKSLAHDPGRCARADEDKRFPIELRQLNFGSGQRTTHRIIFTIREATVLVYAIRHVAQGNWRPEIGTE